MVSHLIFLSIIATCVSLGLWQLRRLEQRRADNARVTAQSALPSRDLQELLSSAGNAQSAVYRRVQTTGTYDSGREVILLARSFKGRPGNHLLTPLVTGSGTAILVDRGWVPMTVQDPADVRAAPPQGRVAVDGILLSGESRGFLGVSDPPPGRVRSIARVDLARLAKQLPYPIYPVYLRLQNQQPANPAPIPEPVPIPPLTEGPHKGYAVQWFAFAATALAVYVSLVRKEIRRPQEDAGRDASSREQEAVPDLPSPAGRAPEADHREAETAHTLGQPGEEAPLASRSGQQENTLT